MKQVHFSSATDDWATPIHYSNQINAEFGGFDLDPAASISNAKCNHFYTKAQNGLANPWFWKFWLNPPYGRDIRQWMKKAYMEASTKKLLVVCLIPARTDTKWFLEYVLGKAQIRFIPGRLKFGQAQASAPFPSLLVIYDYRESSSNTEIA
jgi:site-specific DNA-methyltransferase (adenine-specific)